MCDTALLEEAGGQIIRGKLRSLYGLTRDGMRFYLFDRIPKPKLFKDGYRGRLDALPWDARERANLVAEANEAYRLNRGSRRPRQGARGRLVGVTTGVIAEHGTMWRNPYGRREEN